MNYLGIDPGANGGFAIVNSDRKLIEYLDLSKGGPADWLSWLDANATECHTAIEEVGGMPNMRPQGMFKFGWNVGVLHAFLTARQMPFVTVRPQAWMKALNIPSRKAKDGETQHDYKKRLREVAQRLFPSEKITANIADACLIAYYHATKR